MDYIIIPLVACLASLLTFFSGFGLGTLLTPAFVIFFPIEIAIAMTAIVHFLNGLFKLVLLGRQASQIVLIRFGIPAMIAAFLGAWFLTKVSHYPAFAIYHIAGHEFQIMPVKLVMAFLMIFFTLFEIIPKLRNLEMEKHYLPLGGTLSGFFGGLSGHQGALRSVFLARAGLTKEQFIGTGIVIATMIDVTRLGVYSQQLSASLVSENFKLLILTTLSAFVGAYFGNKLLKKITMQSIQIVVSICLFLLAVALGMGMI